jgi:LuxR family transcriptional regulator, maltose regulon positive regulatory protein
MTAENTISAKITRPGVSGVVRRQRLFRLLDGRPERPVVWISAPAGSGKTKLVSSWLDASRLPCIWYQCDDGDSDLATFFYYMGLAAKKAAPRRGAALPLLNPGYRSGIPAFTRRYFERLYGLLITRSAPRRGFCIVLENYQDVPEGSAFHGMIADGFDPIPEGIRVVVISRSGPPAALARMQANDGIDLLEYADVRFTFEEARALLSGRVANPDPEWMKTIYERTEGWAAGIVLMLERARFKGTETAPDADEAYSGVFDYFGGEIFDKTEKGVREFLVKTAFLPVLSVPLAERLTGVANAGRILSALSRQNFFTGKLSGGGERYQYHPLFRDFLMSRAKAESAPDELAAMQREAALLLEQSGQIEDAARLYKDAGEAQYLARMVIHHARELLGQGRNRTVSEWVAGIPASAAESNPWLLYYAGRCAFPFDMPKARTCLEKASALFRESDDAAGLYLSWAGIVDAYAFEFDEWRHLDGCIEVFEDLRRTYPSFPSRETELVASSRMLMSLILRKTDRPTWVLQWLDRVSALLKETPSADIQTDILFCISLHHLWKGEYQKNAILLERAEAGILLHQPSPFAAIHIRMMKGIHCWVTAQYDQALRMLSEGLDIARGSGVRVFDSLLWSFTAAARMARGDMEHARESLRNQASAALASAKTLDLFFHHINAAWQAMLEGNAPLAAENMETISPMAEKMGVPYYRALWHIGMSQAAFLQDRVRDARGHIHAAHRISRDTKSRVLEWYSLLIEAWILLKGGREAKGMASLRRGLALGKGQGYVHLEFYQPSVMRFLCARALEQGIDPEYVKGLIAKLGLTPPEPFDAGDPAIDLEAWPYPVQIRTLGRFEVIRDGEPLPSPVKMQKKPLEMLKAIIAFGGADVPADRLTDALWPDAEGDHAHKSFEMTLSRLRRLLGGEEVVRYGSGQLGIDPSRCRVDSLVLERLIGEIRKSPEDRIAGLCEKALGLYRGPFLPDTALPWAVHRRELLKNVMLRIVITAGRHCEQAGQWERATEYYIKGLDTDDLAEVFYQRLMVCYQKLGSNADAVRTYRRCRSLLADRLGVRPSAETEALRASLLEP